MHLLRRRNPWLLALAIGILALWATAVSAAPVTRVVGPFTVIFYNTGDSDGSATSAATWTTTQMDDVAAMIGVWQGGLANTPGRQIVMHAFWENFDGGILGGSYSPTNGDGATAWTYPEHVWRDGVDYSGPWTDWDTIIQYDTDAAGLSWNFGSGAPAGGQIDFRSVIAHEIGHSLGFYDTYDNSDDSWGNNWGTTSDPGGFAGYLGLTQWDQHLRDDSNNRPANNSTGTPGNFNELDNPVWWTGTSANALYGGPVPIYAPPGYQGGSSLAHVNNVGVTDALMNPFISLGTAHRDLTAVEWAMMQDMGWTLASAVPEPSTFALLGLAFGLVMVLRRR
jgi:hypothetical protein